jgi:hypothetical protein
MTSVYETFNSARTDNLFIELRSFKTRHRTKVQKAIIIRFDIFEMPDKLKQAFLNVFRENRLLGF